VNSKLIGVYAVIGIIGLAVLWIGGITLSGGFALASRVAVPPSSFDARGGDVQRGRHLASAVLACTDCHGADLGGAPFVSGGIGRVAAPNLTSAGIGHAFTDTDFERAIRHGVAPDGTRLYFMPSAAYAALSDADLRDVIAYVRSVPGVDRPTPPREFGFGGRMLAVTHTLPAAADHIDQTAPHPAFEQPAATAAYGKYLAAIAGCFECHGPDLAGGHYGPHGTPRAANLTPAALGTWSQAQFATALRDGRDPNGRQLDPYMPSKAFAGMNDREIAALYTFLKTVPPVKD